MNRINPAFDFEKTLLTREYLLSVSPAFRILETFYILALGTRGLHFLSLFSRSTFRCSSMSPYK